MKVFLSWSGDRSRGIAEVLKTWLPGVLQAIKPYFSPDDVTKGSRWSSEVAKELEASSVALIILTPENQEAPWLLFEAGALSKNLDRSIVCPLLFGGMQPTDVKGPLVQFQAAQFSFEEMKRVLTMINGELGEIALTTTVLDEVFDMWWPKLEREVDKQVNASVKGKTPHRSERELLEEVLALTRGIDSKRGPTLSVPLPQRASMDLVESAADLAAIAIINAPTRVTFDAFHLLKNSLDFLTRQGYFGATQEHRIVDLMARLSSLEESRKEMPNRFEMLEDILRGVEPVEKDHEPGIGPTL
jgi:hypothetical protein